MLYEDRYGRLWSEDDLYNFLPEDIEELEIHLFDKPESPLLTTGEPDTGGRYEARYEARERAGWHEELRVNTALDGMTT